jgi:hypothetical protein
VRGGEQALALTPARGASHTLLAQAAAALGLAVWAPLGRHGRDMRPATQRRWQWPWVWDASVCQKDGAPLGGGGRGGSGQDKRVLSGLDGRLLRVVVGAGRLRGPVACALRRPAPVGPGAPCRAKRWGARRRLAERLAAVKRRGVGLPPPSVVAERWGRDATRRQPGHAEPQGTVRVEGQGAAGLTVADGRRGPGSDRPQGAAWPWRQPPWEPRVRYVRWRATSPTSGKVTVVLVEAPQQDRGALRGLETPLSAPQWLRRWRRRRWSAVVLRPLTPLVAPEAWQVRSADASYGPRVWRLLGSFLLFSTARVLCKGRLPMAEILFALKHSWRFVALEPLERQALSSGRGGQVA